MYRPEDIRLPWAAPGHTSEARPYYCRFDAAGRLVELGAVIGRKPRRFARFDPDEGSASFDVGFHGSYQAKRCRYYVPGHEEGPGHEEAMSREQFLAFLQSEAEGCHGVLADAHAREMAVRAAREAIAAARERRARIVSLVLLAVTLGGLALAWLS